MGHLDRYIKTKEEQEIMRQGGKILAQMLSHIKSLIKPNVDSWELEKAFLSLCEEHKVLPSCKGYDPFDLKPFPTGLCVSINSQCVHCYPKKGVILKAGDIITVDTVILYKGFNLDAAFAVAVGKVSDADQNLLKTTEEALYKAISQVSDGVRLGKVSNTIDKTAKKTGLNVIKDYAGHGIGKEMHEWPQIACYGDKNSGPKLKTGMTICIESLICTGSDKVSNVDLWETRMKDGGKFAQFEHTVLVKDDGYEILTLS
jgi:methionyl aminopeptidase